jgi:hypothetical protein
MSAPTAITMTLSKFSCRLGANNRSLFTTPSTVHDVGAAFIWLKNRDPERWRDVQNVEHVMGKYLISDKPMTLEEWASARATVVNEVIDDSVTPALPQDIEQRKKDP